MHLIYDLHKVYAGRASLDASAAPCAEIDAVFLLEVLKLVIDAVLKALFPFLSKDVIARNPREFFHLAAAP